MLNCVFLLRYEEEIRLLEMERGIDVEFINPIPGHCLKSHHWPKVYAADATHDHSDGESVKVFINVCKSDKVECPIIKSAVDSNGEKVSGGCFWRLPHCLSPPREDFDKKKRRVMIYDVAFHSKAFDLAFTRSTLRRLLDYTAVDGVRRQFNLCLGKTAQQAVYLAQLLGPTEHPTESSNAFASPVCVPQSPMHEEALLKAVRTLKGTAYKGIARPTVIRRRRPDYASRQAELDRRISEDMQNCSDASQREALKMLATYPCVSSERAPNRTTKDLASPTEPRYTVTHCSEFDMINSRDAPDVNPLRPPDSLKIAIKLPGLSSSACLDLDVTSTHLMLTVHRSRNDRSDRSSHLSSSGRSIVADITNKPTVHAVLDTPAQSDALRYVLHITSWAKRSGALKKVQHRHAAPAMDLTHPLLCCGLCLRPLVM
ncbi:unnamed protein product [Dicrocoelium dendriticum]|nr:unnamed protein product [Dicrocoelium dendriticum]